MRPEFWDVTLLQVSFSGQKARFLELWMKVACFASNQGDQWTSAAWIPLLYGLRSQIRAFYVPDVFCKIWILLNSRAVCWCCCSCHCRCRRCCLLPVVVGPRMEKQKLSCFVRCRYILYWFSSDSSFCWGTWQFLVILFLGHWPLLGTTNCSGPPKSRTNIHTTVPSTEDFLRNRSEFAICPLYDF